MAEAKLIVKVDAVIRCRDCANYTDEGCRLPDYDGGGMLNTSPDGYCSDAVKKEAADEA